MCTTTLEECKKEFPYPVVVVVVVVCFPGVTTHCGCIFTAQ
jgi:hypothetical protein